MKRFVGFVLVLVAALGLTGCCCCFALPDEDRGRQVIERIHTGETQREPYVVAGQDIEQAKVVVRFAGGDLDIYPGEEDLLDAEFTYNLQDLEPVVEYTTRDETGELLLRHESDQIRWDRSTQIRNEWLLTFGTRVPIDMELAVGASKGTLDLSGIPLQDLRVEAGAAEMDIRFDSLNPEPLSMLYVRSGAAKLQLLGLGNANFEEMLFDGGLGSYTFDLTGEWQHSAEVAIQAGASRIELIVPSNIGVRVCPGDLRQGDYGSLTEQDRCYVNSLYDNAELQLEIELDLGLAQLTVKEDN